MNKKIRVAVAGLGAIGKSLSTKLAAGAVPGVELTAVSAKNHDKANEFVKTLAHPVKVLRIEDLEPEADVVVECAPAEFLGDIIAPFLKKQKKAIVLSVGAILFRPDLVELAKQSGGVIMVPTGALIGLDAMIGAADLIENNISVQGLTEPLKVFSGNAKEAAKGFPANLNVVVALALAGNGPENTLLEIWADPTVVRNTHTITVDSDSAKFTMTMENIPSENPKTGRIVAQSVVAMLRKMTSHFQVGT
ncbi:MAG: hypothetical protein RL082_1115 [Pseudomonadota bacterium]